LQTGNDPLLFAAAATVALLALAVEAGLGTLVAAMEART
jgi:hypothetical protein